MNEPLLRFPTPLERTAALAELKRALQTPPVPVPDAALKLLHEAASMDTGGSQAIRNLLFWLTGQPDPTGYAGHGGLELRRLDRPLRTAALEGIRIANPG